MLEVRNEPSDTLQERIFKAVPGFRDWILTTKLFHAIKQYSGNPVVSINAFTDNETLSLALNNKHVETPEELPIELLIKFYDNYPNKPYRPILIEAEDTATIMIDHNYNKSKSKP